MRQALEAMDRGPLESRLAFRKRSSTFWLRHQIQGSKSKAQEQHPNTKRQQLSGRRPGGWEARPLQDASMGWRRPGIELPRACPSSPLDRPQCSAVGRLFPPIPNPLPRGEGTACEGLFCCDASAANLGHGTSNNRRTVLPLPWGEGNQSVAYPTSIRSWTLKLLLSFELCPLSLAMSRLAGIPSVLPTSRRNL